MGLSCDNYSFCFPSPVCMMFTTDLS
uniref:Uncharacterized protein n=1 Tax=Anguilla anguilla TaxID=7936 RepID=A0A0E9R8L9_ANGAN